MEILPRMYQTSITCNTIPIRLSELNARLVRLVGSELCFDRPSDLDRQFVRHCTRLHRKVFAQFDEPGLSLHVPSDRSLFTSLVCRRYCDFLTLVEQRLLSRLHQLNLRKHVTIVCICRRRLQLGKLIANHLRRMHILQLHLQKRIDEMENKMQTLMIKSDENESRKLAKNATAKSERDAKLKSNQLSPKSTKCRQLTKP
jgi:hypothetical protein